MMYGHIQYHKMDGCFHYYVMLATINGVGSSRVLDTEFYDHNYSFVEVIFSDLNQISAKKV